MITYAELAAEAEVAGLEDTVGGAAAEVVRARVEVVAAGVVGPTAEVAGGGAAPPDVAGALPPGAAAELEGSWPTHEASANSTVRK